MKLAKAYEPNQYEPSIYALWETSGVFNHRSVDTPVEEESTGGKAGKNTSKRKTFSTVMPPPNANGNLHIGHALDMGLKDIMVRYKRMNGYDAVFIPGADHAGFETWVVYEKELQKQGKSRFSFTREQLYAQVWDFVHKQRGNMELQLRALGTSAAWDHMVFTLDSKVIETVYHTFKKLWEDGLIYRGERIVNYSTKYQTSYADIEVDHKVEKGKLWHISYPLIDKIGEIIIATTRPETMFGDVAVAVNPNDERYKDMVGKHVVMPLTGKEIPIIADDYVDPKFGSGAVKITPAHDPNDFEVGKRHDLPRPQVIDFDGKMINVPPQFIGLEVEAAREKVLAALRAEEVIRKEEEIEHTVGYDYKSGLPIQPLIKDQWFLKMEPLAARALQAIEAGEITFYPESRKQILIQYLKGIHDWNLSRQIPWGIPIPAFQNVDDENDWIYNENVEEKTTVINDKTYKREEDTFDTWFSSGQWPFITTDYLTGGELARFFPTDLLETGTDLLDRWVARMIMLSLYVTDKIPFKTVYLHGMVLDEHNQKMSKSKGNVINPMDMVAEYGSDALRLGLIANRSPGQNQAFGIDRIISGRNFCNKLWNISRFILDKLGEDYKPLPPIPFSTDDHWIVGELKTARDTIMRCLDDYRFSEAGEAVYHAIWDSIADWYIEASKDQDNPNMLVWVLETALKLAHPFAPFVTETIWQTIPWRTSLLAAETWPEIIEYNQISAAQFEQIQQVITEARVVAAAMPGNDRYGLLYENDALIADNASLIMRLAKLTSIDQTDQPRGLRLALANHDAWLDISQKTLDRHQENIEARIATTRQEIATLENRLSNDNYVSKAPTALVEASKQQLNEKQALVERLLQELELLK